MKNPAVVLAFVALFLLGFVDNSRGPVYPQLLETFNITKAEGAFIFSLSSLTALVFAILSPWWLRKFNTFKITRFGLLVQSFSCLLMGMSSSFEGIGFTFFLCASIVLGASLGINSLTVNILVDQSEVKSKRKIYGALHASYGLASLLAPICVSLFYKLGISWENFFFLIAIFPLSIFILSFNWVQVKPKIEERSIDLKLFWEFKELGLLFAFYVSSEVLISSRLALILSEKFKFSAAEASISLSVFFCLLLIGRASLVFDFFKVDSYKLLWCSVITTIITLFLGYYVHPMFLVLSGLTFSVFYPSAMGLISTNLPGNVSGIVSIANISAGLFLVFIHWFFGLIATLKGIDTAFHIVFILLVGVLYILQLSSKHFTDKAKVVNT